MAEVVGRSRHRLLHRTKNPRLARHVRTGRHRWRRILPTVQWHVQVGGVLDAKHTRIGASIAEIGSHYRGITRRGLLPLPRSALLDERYLVRHKFRTQALVRRLSVELSTQRV